MPKSPATTTSCNQTAIDSEKARPVAWHSCSREPFIVAPKLSLFLKETEHLVLYGAKIMHNILAMCEGGSMMAPRPRLLCNVLAAWQITVHGS